MSYIVKCKAGDNDAFLRLEKTDGVITLQTVQDEIGASVFNTRAQVLRVIDEYAGQITEQNITGLPTTKEEVEKNEVALHYNGSEAGILFKVCGRGVINIDPTVGLGAPSVYSEDPDDNTDGADDEIYD